MKEVARSELPGWLAVNYIFLNMAMSSVTDSRRHDREIQRTCLAGRAAGILFMLFSIIC